MESVWPVTKLSTESVGSHRELVANCVHTTDADATKQFRCVGIGGVYWTLFSPELHNCIFLFFFWGGGGFRGAATSDEVKDTDGKAKAKDISHEAKTKAKDLTLKAKAKDTSHKAKAKTKDIQHKPKSLCHGDLSLWRDVMSESSCWHTRLVTKTHH